MPHKMHRNKNHIVYLSLLLKAYAMVRSKIIYLTTYVTQEYN